MNKHHRLSLLVSLALAACGPTEEPLPEDQELHGTIGAAGGTLAGEPGTPFEGVSLEVPASALAGDTDISIVPAFDETPLPDLAERVGAQFTIIAPERSFLSPVRLTLPVDADTVARFGQGAADVKVWVREGDGWALREALATAEGTITIELAAPTTAAAGVKLVATPLLCGTGGFASCLVQACASTVGVCIRSLGVASPRPENLMSMAVDATSIYYLTQPALGRIAAVRRPIATGTTVVSDPVGAFETGRMNLSLDERSAIWVGLGSAGNAELRFDGPAQRYAPPIGILGQGGVRSANGTFATLTSQGRQVRRSGTFGSVVAWPAGTRLQPVASDPTAPEAFWAAVSSNTLRRFTLGANDPQVTVTLPSTQSVLFQSAPMSVAPDGTVAVLTSPGNRVFAGRPGELADQVSSIAAFDIAYDTIGRLWIAPIGSAELFAVGPGTRNEAIPLTQAAPDTLEYANAIPRVIRALPDGRMVVLTQGRTLLIVQSN